MKKFVAGLVLILSSVVVLRSQPVKSHLTAEETVGPRVRLHTAQNQQH